VPPPDITDTATVLQIREALVLVDRELAAISAAMARFASGKHRDTPRRTAICSRPSGDLM
jgi:adenylosuccinate lyase